MDTTRIETACTSSYGYFATYRADTAPAGIADGKYLFRLVLDSTTYYSHPFCVDSRLSNIYEQVFNYSIVQVDPDIYNLTFTLDTAIRHGRRKLEVDLGAGAGYENKSVGNVLTSSVTGLTSLTTYYYRVRATTSSCTTTSSNVITAATFGTIPYSESFDTLAAVGTTVVGASTNLPTGWNSASAQWSSSNATTYNDPRSSANYIRCAWSSTNAFVWSPGIALTAEVPYTWNSYVQGDGYTSWALDLFVNTTQSSVSATQLGATYSPTGPGTQTKQSYVLVSRTFTPTSSGVYYFAYRVNESSGSPWYLAVDDISIQAPCAAPAAPTALTQGTTGPGSIAESFTANATKPDGYMVVRYPAGSVVTAPVNGTLTYVLNGTLGLGTISNIVGGNSSTFTVSGLAPNTAYDLYVYPYTIINCIGGPVFGTALSTPVGGHTTSGCSTIPSSVTIGATGDFATLTSLSLLLNFLANFQKYESYHIIKLLHRT